MLKKHFTPLFLFLFIMAVMPAPLYAMTEEEDQKCDEAMQEAKDKLHTYILDSQQVMNISANRPPNQQQQSPANQMFQQAAQCPGKIAEANAEAMKTQGEISDKWESEDVKIGDKLQEMKTLPYRQNIEKIKAHNEKYKADQKIIDFCDDEATTTYNAKKQQTDAAILNTTHAVTSLSRVSGTKSRQTAEWRDFRNDCIARKQSAFAGNIRDLNTQTLVMREQQMISISDYNHMVQNRQRLKNYATTASERAQSMAETKKWGVIQGCVASLVGAGVSSMMSTAQANTDQNTAGTSVSAREAYMNFAKIEIACKNDMENKNYAVPNDVYPLFSKVNSVCRPGTDPTKGCVRDTRQNSSERKAASTLATP